MIHSIVEWRPDRAGMIVSSPLLAIMTKYDDHVLAGGPTAEIVPELGPEPEDIVSSRASGVSPFTATNLDHLLRSERATTVVAAGAGLTMGILGLAIEAVGLGYSVVVPEDAVVDVDPEYASLVWAKTLRLIVTRTTGRGATRRVERELDLVAAVDADHLAGDPPAVVRGEQRRHAGELFGLEHAVL